MIPCWSVCPLCAVQQPQRRCQRKHRGPALPVTEHRHSTGGIAGHYWRHA